MNTIILLIFDQTGFFTQCTKLNTPRAERVFLGWGIYKKEHIISGVQVCFKVTIGFTAESFCAIPLYCIAKTTGQGKSDSVESKLVGQIEQLCPCDTCPFPVFEQIFKISRTLYMLFTAKASCF